MLIGWNSKSGITKGYFWTKWTKEHMLIVAQCTIWIKLKTAHIVHDIRLHTKLKGEQRKERGTQCA
jgi:hypothetical protein